jgi:hypothetical protein
VDRRRQPSATPPPPSVPGDAARSASVQCAPAAARVLPAEVGRSCSRLEANRRGCRGESEQPWSTGRACTTTGPATPPRRCGPSRRRQPAGAGFETPPHATKRSHYEFLCSPGLSVHVRTAITVNGIRDASAPSAPSSAGSATEGVPCSCTAQQSTRHRVTGSSGLRVTRTSSTAPPTHSTTTRSAAKNSALRSRPGQDLDVTEEVGHVVDRFLRGEVRFEAVIGHGVLLSSKRRAVGLPISRSPGRRSNLLLPSHGGGGRARMTRWRSEEGHRPLGDEQGRVVAGRLAHVADMHADLGPIPRMLTLASRGLSRELMGDTRDTTTPLPTPPAGADATARVS